MQICKISVAYVKEQIDFSSIFRLLSVHTMIKLTSSKPLINYKLIEALVPLPWCLFKPVQCLLKFAHITLFSFNNTPLRLLHIDLFFNNSMKKCSLNVKLLQLNLFIHRKGKKQPYRDVFYNR